MSMISYLVSSFEKQTITNLVRECFGYDFPDIFEKDQVDYVFNYLSKLPGTQKAKSVLLEYNYVDKDYLEDFSRYYVKRFGNDGHKCARLHFFSQDVDHRRITEILEGGKRAPKQMRALNASYLGFMVIKPLPRTFIGKTCLRVLPDVFTNDKKKCRLAREYKVDLFGIPLTVKSIAFQEQDKVVAACATTAIWTALHALAWRDSRSIPSCSEITINAVNHVEGSANSFPSKQLSNKQILRSLDVEGLRYHAESMEKPDRKEFLQSVMAHVNSALPLILTGEVFTGRADGKYYGRGGHAISIVGYKVDAGEEVLYVHDDRLGPFARAKLVELDQYTLEGAVDKRDQKWALGLQRMKTKNKWQEPHELIVPLFSIVPGDKKARLPFYYIYETCNLISAEATNELRSKMGAEAECIEYHIKLREISSIRQEVLKHVAKREVSDDGSTSRVADADYESWKNDKQKFLTTSFARLQWSAVFSYEGTALFTVFFDASEIPQGHAVSSIYVQDINLAKVVLDAFRGKDPDKIENNMGHFYQSFLRRLKIDTSSRESYLDTTYGTPRAPKKLRPTEFEGGKIKLNETLKTFYEPTGARLLEMFPRFAANEVANLIWAISLDGDLLVAEEYDTRGHPSITGFKPARIAGEIRHPDGAFTAEEPGQWLLINAKSGRYSSDYFNTNELLENARSRFERYFPERFHPLLLDF
ncbi:MULTISPECIES: hypothetical protein [Pseudomonas]|uniref:hypothetical protein n=1 Tax=Pseudomonas TaxID=286 RepID=UPI001E58BEB7|nr:MULTISPECIES: hypothetical protein [Pseudomonas]MCE0780170.1 hypothetical protein [Pseudomonas sp. NMI542_15]MCE0974543.1 hypothetical protein [Pseudomonas putida]MDT3750263.1 hypothetical protein [Pseudomonas kurunegalensis]